jgi:transcription-repair coupling factor (superfamily II helicase)
MDRLVCGDVGYGKTEVALRAAAAVAFSGKQVALLAPTTVLARQHFGLLQRRFAGTGGAVALVIGGQKKQDSEGARRGLAEGSIAIAVGTHALATPSIRFDDLALVVIDEEQRFGTRHKAALQSLGRGRHSLALSATPIPRTLQAAMAGLRDLSVIDTPPHRRRPVRTVLSDADPALIQSALRREANRAGQSFCIVPRIADLDHVAAEVGELVPGLRVVQAHGRMKAAALDEAMLSFAEGRADILVATAIVESGIDIPRANTILVWRPDLFGLGQLHQLRGRVGRGAAQAYAYLLTDPEHELPERTATRLRALETIESLGGGFRAAMIDLDRRGAGDLVGEEQTGHLTAIGTELYQHLLGRALERANGQPTKPPLPEIKLDVPLSVPEAYIPETELRIGLHRRLARATDASELTELADEIRDRFGPLPEPTEALIKVAGLRLQAGDLGLRELRAGPAAIVLQFADPQDAARVAESFEADADATGRLVLRRASASPEERLLLVAETLDRTAGLLSRANSLARGSRRPSRRKGDRPPPRARRTG